MIKRSLVFAPTLALLMVLAPLGSGVAQSQPEGSAGLNQEQRQGVQAVPLSEKELYRGWLASDVLGKPIWSVTGRTLGTVRNLILGKNGQITAVIVERDRSTLLPEFVLRIPWQQVQITKLPDRLIADILAGEDPLYGIFQNDSEPSPEEFSVTEITGDYARLQAGQGYGYVSDAVFTRMGNLFAVLITRDSKAGGGTYAFGFPERPVERWNAATSYYGLPYATAKHADTAAIHVDLSRFRNNGTPGPDEH